MSALRVLAISASRSEERPTSSGFARGSGSDFAVCALAEQHIAPAIMRAETVVRIAIITFPSLANVRSRGAKLRLPELDHPARGARGRRLRPARPVGCSQT